MQQQAWAAGGSSQQCAAGRVEGVVDDVEHGDGVGTTHPAYSIQSQQQPGQRCMGSRHSTTSA